MADLQATLKTNKGDIVVELNAEKAPNSRHQTPQSSLLLPL